MVIHTLNLALQHRQLDDAAVRLSQVAMSREIKQMQLSVEPRVVERRFTRHRDYFTVPTSALRPQNRLELLREKPGFTLSLSGGPTREPHLQYLLSRRNIPGNTQEEEEDLLSRGTTCLYKFGVLGILYHVFTISSSHVTVRIDT